MKNLLIFSMMLLVCKINFAQAKYFTKAGKINFDATATTSVDKVLAVNKSVACVLDSKTGEIQFSVLMRGFEFEKALMMEHFNENYVESAKFPKASFKGNILNLSTINFTSNGVYTVKVKGKLTIHGETRDIETTGSITVKNGKLLTNAVFNIVPADYKISIPSLVADKVAKTAKITIACTLEILPEK